MMDAAVRFFPTHGDSCITLEELRCSPESAILELETGTEQDWECLLLKRRNGAEIARIHYCKVVPFGPGRETILECVKGVQGKEPIGAADWLVNHLRRVQMFYVFHPLNGARIDQGWREIEAVAGYLWSEHMGVFEIGEGFTNEWGYYILFQNGAAAGIRWAGLLQPSGDWIHFKIDLGDKKQREAFSHGTLPEGVELAPHLNDPFDLRNPFETA
jgi:hypothetical protein